MAKKINNKEVWNGISKELKEKLYPLIGQAYMTGKRITVPKDIYNVLSYEERLAVRAILDFAVDAAEK